MTNSRFSVFFLGTKLWNEILNEEEKGFEYSTSFQKMHQTKVARYGARMPILIRDKYLKNEWMNERMIIYHCNLQQI